MDSLPNNTYPSRGYLAVVFYALAWFFQIVCCVTALNRIVIGGVYEGGESMELMTLLKFMGIGICLCGFTFFHKGIFLKAKLRRFWEHDSEQRAAFLKMSTEEQCREIHGVLLLVYLQVWATCVAVSTLGLILVFMSLSPFYSLMFFVAGFFLTYYHRFSYAPSIEWIRKGAEPDKASEDESSGCSAKQNE